MKMGLCSDLISYFFMLGALICHWNGIVSTSWTSVSDFQAGLWWFCSNSSGCQSLPQTFITGRISAARGLEVTSLVLAVVITAVYCAACLKHAFGPKINFMLAMGMNLTGMMCIVGASTYAISADYRMEAGSGLVLTLAAGFFYLFVATPYLLVEPIKKIFDLTKTAESTDPEIFHTQRPQSNPTPDPQCASSPNHRGPTY